MERVVLAVAVVVAAAVVAVLLERRRSDAPTQARPPGSYPVPTQLDRADFDHPDAPWLVAVFTSATCDACAAVVAKARAVDSGPDAGENRVAVVEVEVGAQARLHQRYEIEAVPTTVVADREGVVQASFVGNPGASELWAAVAEVRSHDQGKDGG